MVFTAGSQGQVKTERSLTSGMRRDPEVGSPQSHNSSSFGADIQGEEATTSKWKA